MQLNNREQIKRILAVRLDNIGDVVMLGPALRSLRKNFPQADITLLASPAGAQAARLLPWIDRCMQHRAIWQDAKNSMAFDPFGERRFIETIRHRYFDAAFVFTSFSQSCYPPAYAAYVAGIPVRVGQAADFGGSVLSHCVKPLPTEAHQVDRNLHLLESVGLATEGKHLELVIPAEVEECATKILNECGVMDGRPFLLLAPGASCPARRYPVERFAAVTRELLSVTNLPVVVVGNEKERQSFAPILQLPGKIISLVGKIGVPHLSAVIAKSALVIANDSGPMHIADAFERPMVILYSGTEYESQWRPRNSPAVLLRRPTDCSPCYRFECPFHMECLDIDPKRVVEAVSGLLFSNDPVRPDFSDAIPSSKEENQNVCAPYVC